VAWLRLPTRVGIVVSWEVLKNDVVMVDSVEQHTRRSDADDEILLEQIDPSMKKQSLLLYCV
jgi:hypothetical protein